MDCIRAGNARMFSIEIIIGNNSIMGNTYQFSSAIEMMRNHAGCALRVVVGGLMVWVVDGLVG
jgi:hypothetical protein